MSAIPADLQAFLNEHRDSREYRRGLAVKLALQGYLYATICEMLDVTPGFISQAKTAYETTGIDGLRLKYQGGQPFLSDDQLQAVITWLKAQQTCSVELLRNHIETTYAVVYQSKQSYYELLAEAGISYKRAQARNPKHDPEQLAAKKSHPGALDALGSTNRSQGGWLSRISMNVTSVLATRVDMFGDRAISASRFRSSINAIAKPTMVLSMPIRVS